MAPRNHTPKATTSKEFRYYVSQGQKDFGWENPKTAKLRDAIKRSRLRKEKAAKRDYARPPHRGKKRSR